MEFDDKVLVYEILRWISQGSTSPYIHKYLVYDACYLYSELTNNPSLFGDESLGNRIKGDSLRFYVTSLSDNRGIVLEEALKNLKWFMDYLDIQTLYKHVFCFKYMFFFRHKSTSLVYYALRALSKFLLTKLPITNPGVWKYWSLTEKGNLFYTFVNDSYLSLKDRKLARVKTTTLKILFFILANIRHLGGKPNDVIKRTDSLALSHLNDMLRDEICFHKFVEMVPDPRWSKFSRFMFEIFMSEQYQREFEPIRRIILRYKKWQTNWKLRLSTIAAIEFWVEKGFISEEMMLNRFLPIALDFLKDTRKPVREGCKETLLRLIRERKWSNKAVYQIVDAILVKLVVDNSFLVRKTGLVMLFDASEIIYERDFEEGTKVLKKYLKYFGGEKHPALLKVIEERKRRLVSGGWEGLD